MGEQELIENRASAMQISKIVWYALNCRLNNIKTYTKMLNKSKFKYIQSLGQKKLRDEEGVFIAEGPKLLEELLQQPNIKPVEIFALEDWQQLLTPHQQNKLNDILTLVKPLELERLSFLTSPHLVLGVFSKPVFASAKSGIVLMLDGIQDPGNLGTIIRLADWYNISQIICSMDCADAFNTKVVQSTMGSITRVEVVYTDLITYLQKNKKPVYATTLDGTDLQKTATVQQGIIIIGSEGKGISDAVLKFATNKITIPKLGKAESLNAAVATGIALSHLIGRGQ